MSLDGRHALVTGVSRRAGIGYSIARRLLEAGAAVFVQGWTPHDAAQRWGAEQGGTEAVAADLGVPFAEVDFADPSEFVPAVVVITTMPLTFSIAHGIAFGFIAYAGIKLLAGRPRDVSVAVAVLAALFVVKFALL